MIRMLVNTMLKSYKMKGTEQASRKTKSIKSTHVQKMPIYYATKKQK